MDGASEGQATDGRSGRGLRQKGRRAEQVSAQQPRAVRQNHGMAVVARRQVVTGPPCRSDSSDLVPWHGALSATAANAGSLAWPAAMLGISHSFASACV